MTELQEKALRDICARYGVEFDPAHYTPAFDLPAGYLAGWVGGVTRSAIGTKVGYTPTIFIGVSPEGEISS